MSRLTESQCRIICLSEEAGEDGFVAIGNSVTARTGRCEELIAYIADVSSLLHQELLTLATSRDPSTLQWISLSREEAALRLDAIVSRVMWSTDERMWRWNSSEPRFQVILSDTGINEARKFLSVEGTGNIQNSLPAVGRDERRPDL